MIYYIGDIHFKDQRIFELCSRPFKSLEEFENIIISNWNKVVTDDDTVYVLGDISKDDDFAGVDLYKKLNGHKHLIIGNHDWHILSHARKSKIFESFKTITLINDSGRQVCLCHYPIMDWIEYNKGSYHIYGHIHNKTGLNDKAYTQIKDYYKDKLAFNCGIDVIGFVPRTLDELIILKEDNKDEAYCN